MITKVSVGPDKRTELEKAIRTLKKYYGIAVGVNEKQPGFIRNPIAWALYQTWKEKDK